MLRLLCFLALLAASGFANAQQGRTETGGPPACGDEWWDPRGGPDGKGGYTIIVCGGCAAGEARFEGTCMSESLLNFLYARTSGLLFSPGNPGSPDSGGTGGSERPPDEIKTKEQCKQDLNKCQSEPESWEANCVAASTLQAIQDVFPDKPDGPMGTCFDNRNDVLEEINRFAISPLCGTEQIEGTEPDLFHCRFSFMMKALRQCFHGSPKNALSSITIALPVLEMTFDIEAPPGQGTLAACKSAARAYKTACAHAYATCMVDATPSSQQKIRPGGASTGTAPQGQFISTGTDPASTIARLLREIDRSRLGLSATGPRPVTLRSMFASTERKRWESEDLYIDRLRFLAKWSIYLKQQGITRAQQTAAQEAFEDAQYAFSGIMQDAATILAAEIVRLQSPWSDNEKRRVHVRFLEFFRGRESSGPFNQNSDSLFNLRKAAVEQSLKSSIMGALGPARGRQFVAKVWPGIEKFGYASPMTPRQVVLGTGR